MKRKSILIVLSGLLFFGLFATNVFAQDQDKPITPDQPVVQEQPRVIEEAIVLSDPTVAQSRKWLIGLSGEYWYVYQQYNRYYTNGTTYSTGTINGGMPGGTITLGYDAFTLAYSFRKGSFEANSTFGPETGHPDATSVLKQDQTEHEITARWLFKVSPHFNPYILVGYNHTIKDDEETVDAAHVWGYNSSRVSKNDRIYKSPLFGLGAIIPFNKYIGMRLDGRVLYSWSERVREDGVKWSGTGAGGAVVGTFYWNIWQGLNAQVGGKYQYLNGGDDGVGSNWKIGAYGMIGYTYKF